MKVFNGKTQKTQIILKSSHLGFWGFNPKNPWLKKPKLATSDSIIVHPSPKKTGQFLHFWGLRNILIDRPDRNCSVFAAQTKKARTATPQKPKSDLLYICLLTLVQIFILRRFY
jgi:hypothetical protein